MLADTSTPPGKGLTVVSIALGAAASVFAVLTVVLFAVPDYGMALLMTTPLGAGLAIVLGVVGLIVTILSWKRTARKTLPLVGLLTSSLGLVVGIIAIMSVFGGSLWG